MGDVYVMPLKFRIGQDVLTLMFQYVLSYLSIYTLRTPHLCEICIFHASNIETKVITHRNSQLPISLHWKAYVGCLGTVRLFVLTITVHPIEEYIPCILGMYCSGTDKVLSSWVERVQISSSKRRIVVLDLV